MSIYVQGDLLKAEGIRDLILVVSKNVYNKTRQAIVCPVRDGRYSSPTTYILEEKGQTVICDHLRYLDLDARNIRKTGEVSINDMVEISNIVESLFDYY